VISLLTYDPAAVRAEDEKVSAVLDCATFYSWRDDGSGHREAWFRLVKPIKGLPAGTVLRLRDLHERLFA